MANRTLFASRRSSSQPPTNTINLAGGKAYALSSEHALAQLAATGTFGNTFYASAQHQLDEVRQVADGCHPEFLAKTAVFARREGHMKDMPALLCAMLAVADRALLERVFPQVIDSPKMLRNFVQILRSGVVGRRSLGTAPKRLVRQALASYSDRALDNGAVGASPSLADVVKMVHPKPATESRRALYGYLLGRPYDAAHLPACVQAVEAFKADPAQAPVPKVDFRRLTALPLTREHWAEIARTSTWQQTRINLNTYLRHKAFEVPGTAEAVAATLRDPAQIQRARVLPYELLVAYLHASRDLPAVVREALQDALELALVNVPTVSTQVYVGLDVSGSMSWSSITGQRKGRTSAARCVDVAALIAAALLRANPRTEVLPFDTKVVSVDVNPRDTVLTNAQRLAAVGGGGTDCSKPLEALNQRRAKGGLVVLVSDNESWWNQGPGRGTQTLAQWDRFKARNPEAKLVCVDLTPNTTTQVQERDDVLNVGGFSDAVFRLIGQFAAGQLHPDHWVGVIGAVEV